MDWLEAREIFQQIEAAGGGSDPDFAELFDGMLRGAVSYARARADWKLADRKERIRMDAHRSSLHDAFIDSCNILARYMAGRGMDVSWRNRLGEDRKEIGDFACYLHCMLGIAAR